MLGAASNVTLVLLNELLAVMPGMRGIRTVVQGCPPLIREKENYIHPSLKSDALAATSLSLSV